MSRRIYCTSAADKMSALHVSPYSGTWYPAEVVELDRLLEDLFERSRQRTGPYLFSDGLGFVVPHAGPQYSGAVAASVYRSLREQKPERIVILAFPHRGGLSGAAIPDVNEISTPLGRVPIDSLLSPRFPRLAERDLCDHSFEIQLPFLQKAAPRARLAPLYVGRIDAGERRAAAQALAAEWTPGTVFVASSDFTHYGRHFGYVPFPVDAKTAGRLYDLDSNCMEAAGSLDSALFLRTLQKTGATVCGASPISLLLDVLHILRPGGLFQQTLDYETSGDLTGDFHHSVSYAGLGYFPAPAFRLSAEDQEVLLASAEATLANLKSTPSGEPVFPRAGSVALQARLGVFVSLHRGEELLGCIGNCAGRVPLSISVPEMTLSAALEDPRFQPGAAVAGPCEVEISVLTPFRRITAAADCEPGRHGALLRLRSRSGLLLPQVATRNHWTAGEFLGAVARKCGVAPHAWRDPDGRVYVFEAQVFSREPKTAG